MADDQPPQIDPENGETQPDEGAKLAEHLRKKRLKPAEAASRGKFVLAGFIVAVVLSFANSFLMPSEPVPPVASVKVEPPATQTPQAPVEAPIQYEEAIGPPLAPPTKVKPPVAATVIPGHGKVAIVLDDCGISSTQMQPLMALPAEITYAFLPYGSATAKYADMSHEGGHDVILHMPMQPVGNENPGPDAIYAGQDSAEVTRRLTDAIGKVPHLIGVNNHMGSAATTDPQAMQAVMEVLKGKGLFFLDSYTNSKSVAYSAAHAAGVPVARRNVFLDNDASPEAVLLQLQQLEKEAKKHGTAIAIGHPHPGTVQALTEWLKTAKERDIELIRLKDLLERSGQ